MTGPSSAFRYPFLGFPGGSACKESACNAGDPSLIPGSGNSLGEGIGFPLQYSCLENPQGQRSLGATVRGVSKSDITERLITAPSFLPPLFLNVWASQNFLLGFSLWTSGKSKQSFWSTQYWDGSAGPEKRVIVAQWLKKKNMPAAVGDVGSIPGSGRSPGEGNGYTPVFLAGESPGL